MGGGTKLVNYGYARLNKDFSGTGNIVEIGKNSTLHDTTIRIHGNNNRIVFGENCEVGSGCSFWMEGNDISILIGSGTTFTRLVHFNAQEDGSRISVGEDCMFSNNIIVRTSDSHPVYDLETGERVNYPADVEIGSHVWIAPNTKVMKGAHIGDGAVIGSDTMVTHGEIKANSMAVGHPARVVKEKIKWTREALF